MSNNEDKSNLEEFDQLEGADQFDAFVPSDFDLDKLPASFKKFLSDNSIDPVIYTVANLPRYIRINNHLPVEKQPTLEDLKFQLETQEVYPVSGLDNFFSVQLSKTTKRISDTKAYKERAIFGIDVSSAIAVQALDIQKDDQILDICCAPGAKLCMISNMLGKNGLGTITGVDLASHRLAICRSLVKKYKVGEKVRLFEADGTTFHVPPPTRLGNRIISASVENDSNSERDKNSNKRQKLEVVQPFWAPKMLRFDSQANKKGLYDKVSIDAECTHDGSILHILKYEKWGWDSFEKNFMDPNRISTIAQLQRDLMKQGWKMLKKGGIMIYSTCSLSIQQNEENVAWFLNEYKDESNLESIPECQIKRAIIKKQSMQPDLQKEIETYCVRFDPVQSRTSGFFVARFRKTLEC